MAITSAEELAQHALNHNLLDETQLRAVWGEIGSRNVGLEDFRQLLLRRDLLTFYQIEHLIAGDRSTFFYGDYKVLYLAGTGTFARVYRATDREGKKLVALKVLRKRFSEVPEEADRFLREGEMCLDLKHPNIVPIYEVGSSGRSYYLVMEFVEGRNLSEFTRIRKVCEPAEATKLILDVCQGLDYAFQRGISHRDLKLSNVLVSSHGHAKLLDFGLAGMEADDDSLQKNENPRAIDYAGLERATGVRKGDLRSDIFFVGCMYYHMLCGKAPMVETRDRAQRLRTDRFKDIPPILHVKEDVLPACALVVNKAMSFDPDRRYQTPGEMIADLQAVLNREAVENGTEGRHAREGIDAEGRRRTVLVVESDIKMQDMLREALKRSGYRVLVMSVPERAMHRFDQDPNAADVAIFSTGLIGEDALRAFNDFAEGTLTKNTPAILLLSERQRSWKAHAKLAPHRVVVNMPIKLRQLRQLLVKLTAAEAGSSS
jgi:serine/threonine-protein kinase